MGHSDRLEELRRQVSAPPRDWGWRASRIFWTVAPFAMELIASAFVLAAVTYLAYRLLPSPDWRSGPSAFLLGVTAGIAIVWLPIPLRLVHDRNLLLPGLRRDARTTRLAWRGRDTAWAASAEALRAAEQAPAADPREKELWRVIGYYGSIASNPDYAKRLGIDLVRAQSAIAAMGNELGMNWTDPLARGKPVLDPE